MTDLKFTIKGITYTVNVKEWEKLLAFQKKIGFGDPTFYTKIKKP